MRFHLYVFYAVIIYVFCARAATKRLSLVAFAFSDIPLNLVSGWDGVAKKLVKYMFGTCWESVNYPNLHVLCHRGHKTQYR